MRHVFLPVLLWLSLSGWALSAPLAPRPQERFLQGTWRLEGTDEKRQAWYLEWTFDRGSYKVEGATPLPQEGSYQIVDVAGDKIILELVERKGALETEKSRIELILDRKKDTLTIKGQGPFKRNKTL